MDPQPQSFIDFQMEIIELYRTIDRLEHEMEVLKMKLHEARTENARLSRELGNA
jgi:hypothetical protein